MAMINARGSTRAGRYVAQPGGYRAFAPAPLPPRPALRLEGEIQALVSDADRALGRLDGSVHTLPNPDLFVSMYVRKEAVMSSQIEGTQSTIDDLLAKEAAPRAYGGPADVEEVTGYVRAMNHGLARLADIPVSVRLVREIHAELYGDVRAPHITPGELRRTQNWIGPPGCSLTDATFVPPPADEVQPALADLERFIHADDAMPLLVKVGLVHAQFEMIHPFLDGNGRVGRMLITLLLCERGALVKPVLYLSAYLKRHQLRYYERLQAVQEEGDFEGWIEFLVRGIIETSTDATETARRILDLREQHRDEIAQQMGRAAGNGHRVLEYLFEHPIVSVKNVRELLETTNAGANQIVNRLTELGLLVEITGQSRNRRFRYEPYVQLFTASTRATA